jgi:hypothetical protein
MSVNRRPTVRVERDEMVRYGVLAMLGMLLMTTPAVAGDKSFTPLPFVTTSSTRSSAQPPLTTTPFVVATQPFTASNSIANPLPFQVQKAPDHGRRRHNGPIVVAPTPAPQVIVVQQPVYYSETVVAAAPSECMTQAYWSYRWIPYTSTQTVWVQGSWAADGSWTDSHWESQPYASGYYEPFWVPSQSYAC